MRRVAALCLVALAFPGVAEAAVEVPAGVKVQRFARGIPHPSNLAVDPNGRLWVTSAGHLTARSDGVWMVPRRGARPRHVVRRLFSALGLLWYRGELYVSHVTPYATVSASGHTGRVVAFSGFDGRRFTQQRVVVDGLPTGRHRVDSLAAGPDARLYLGVGSEFDARRSAQRLSGTVVSFLPDGSGLRVEARGLRNPYGLAFIPGTARLLVSEHGRDDLGLRRPPEELNLVPTAGRVRSYGFPACWGQGGARCRGTRGSLVRLPPHSAPGAVVVAPRVRAVRPERLRRPLRLLVPGVPVGRRRRAGDAAEAGARAGAAIRDGVRARGAAGVGAGAGWWAVRGVVGVGACGAVDACAEGRTSGL